MTKSKLHMLQTLLQEFQQHHPEYTVLVTDVDAERLHDLKHNDNAFFQELDTQIDIHFDDPTNPNIRSI